MVGKQERDGYAKELEDLIPQMEQLVADKQSLEERLSGQDPELKRLRERCSQLQGHLEREQAAGHQVKQNMYHDAVLSTGQTDVALGSGGGLLSGLNNTGFDL